MSILKPAGQLTLLFCEEPGPPAGLPGEVDGYFICHRVEFIR